MTICLYKQIIYKTINLCSPIPTYRTSTCGTGSRCHVRVRRLSQRPTGQQGRDLGNPGHGGDCHILAASQVGALPRHHRNGNDGKEPVRDVPPFQARKHCRRMDAQLRLLVADRPYFRYSLALRFSSRACALAVRAPRWATANSPRSMRCTINSIMRSSPPAS